MKKYFYSMLAASMLFACSQEEIVDITKGEGQKVTFKVEIPDQTKSRSVTDPCFGDGSKATDLIFAMYEDGYPTRLICKDTETGDPGIEKLEDGTFTVTVPMAKDLKYNLLFLAYNPENCAFNIESDPAQTDLKALTMKTSLQANNDAFDAFVGAETMGINEEAQTTIYLKRPFAQVNAATTAQDLSDAATLMATADKSKMVIKNVPRTYNVLTGEATGEVTITYEANGIPECATPAQDKPANEPIVVDGKEYYYLSLAYVLAGATPESKQSTHEAIFEFIRERDNKVVSTLTIPNLPIQRNYRTNVIGNLLTKWEDYEIRIDAEFGGSHLVPIWDGKTMTEPQKDATTGAYLVYTPAEYAWLFNQSNPISRAGTSLTGTIEIMDNIDLSGYEIGGITAARSGELTINGNGFLISNAVVRSGDNDNGTSSASMFVCLPTSKLNINDLSVDNIQVITDENPDHAYAGVIAAYVEGTLNLKEVHVSNSKVHSTQSIGSILGFVPAYGTVTMENCTADGMVLTNADVADESGAMGGLVGRVAGKLTVKGAKVSNTTIEAYVGTDSDQKRSISKYIGNVVGGAVVSITDAAIENVTIEAKNELAETQSCLYGDFLGGWRGTGGSVTINGVTYTKGSSSHIITTSSDLATALSNASDGAIIGISGNIPTTVLNAAGRNITIQGMSDDAALDFTSLNSFVNTIGNITFKNLAIKLDETRVYYSNGINNQGYTNVYEDVDFYGVAVNYGTSIYKNCTFTNTKEGGNSYPAWVYNGTATYEGCTFIGVDRTAKVYCEATNTCNVTFTDCTFKATKTGGTKPNKTGVEVACKNPNVKHFVTINNATVENTAEAEHYGTKVFNIESDNKGNGVVTVDGETHAQLVDGNVLESVLAMNSKSITAYLNANMAIAGGTTAYAGTETECITINGNDKTLTFEDGYRTYVSNAGGKIVLNEVNVVRNTTNTDTHWHNNNIHFNGDVEMNDVTFDKGIAINAKTIMNKVKISEKNVDTYALFVSKGSDLVMNECSIETADNTGRGIKVTYEDLKASEATTSLKISKTSFKTAKKAAILVQSNTQTNIILSEVNIENVTADKVNAVWNDAACPEHYNLVNVSGGTKVQEQD